MNKLPSSIPASAHLKSPQPVRALIGQSRARHIQPSDHLVVLAEIESEIRLREVWMEVHSAAGSIERFNDLAMECCVLDAELKVAAHFYLALKPAQTTNLT